MSTTDYALLFAASLLVGVLVGFVAKRVSDVMEQDEEEDARLLRIQLGVDPPKVHGMPEGEIEPDDVLADDPYVRAMVAASMNAGVPIRGEIALNGELHITRGDEPPKCYDGL